ncbi:MAG: hypothetical protein JOY72_10160 [Actinobacteria bacterium]|nr:hypothetical protein [Actinomycetota bacterium]MBV8480653.1 hypothetical protein [Actinomycetota bacterium]
MIRSLAALVLAAAVAVPAASAAVRTHSLVFYGKPLRAQFINHADDRARGKIVNPFNADALPPPPKSNTGAKGARAGDNAIFTLRLYSDAKLTRPVGTALYSCTFNFAHQAICEADFELTDGTMIAIGPANLDGGTIVLPVTGGTSHYSTAHGQVTSSASSAKSTTQIIRFQLVG